ncbi:DUF4843 domain-containing protein [Sphingobacterium bovistauri]|uniref:DUF4843 domain-containing protein n=1 Tax=Sphingobacterium bovistauri TaxID=2781959 RepID=A0ABS7ZA06_9SPHI|nr:DUF4843 domain-containing protein [Sphingobacterium bovistauri]MCA5006236.1 DUF4843 domain-containing protein [Sphingobacterium bovistauri]
MKSLLQLTSCLVILMFFTRCKHEPMLYEGEEGLYFAVQFGPEWGDEKVWANQPVSPVEFINIAGNVDTIKLKVMITGALKDYDRPFVVNVVSDSTSAIQDENYNILSDELVIKANQNHGFVPIILYRTENIQKEKKELMLQIIPNDHFTIGLPIWKRLSGQWESTVAKGDFKADFHKVQISDFVSKPLRWIGQAPATTGIEGGWWGEFSEKKYRLICEHFDLVYEDFTTDARMPNAKRDVIREYMVRFLQSLYNQGTPILEEDGRLMWFSGVSWSSKIGVPYR